MEQGVRWVDRFVRTGKPFLKVYGARVKVQKGDVEMGVKPPPSEENGLPGPPRHAYQPVREHRRAHAPRRACTGGGGASFTHRVKVSS